MSSRKFMFEGLGQALRFLASAWSRGWGALVLSSLLIATALRFRLAAPMSLPTSLIGLTALLTFVAVQGGLYRPALGKGPFGRAGLRLGAPELRMAAVWALTAIFMFILFLLAFVVVMAFGFAVASSGHGFVLTKGATWTNGVGLPAKVLVGLVATASLWGLIWAGAKIAFGAAATIDRDKVLVLATWPETKGLMAPIVGGRLLLAVIPLAALAGAGALLLRGTPGDSVMTWVAGLAVGLAISGLWLPLDVGLMAYLYHRRLSA